MRSTLIFSPELTDQLRQGNTSAVVLIVSCVLESNFVLFEPYVRFNRFKQPGKFILLIDRMQYFCCGSICSVFWSRIFLLFEPSAFSWF